MQEDQANTPDSSGADQPKQDAQPAAEPASAPQTSTGGGSKGSLKGNKKLGLIAGIIVILIGVIVAAYYLVYLPNTPQNVLKKSVANALRLQQVSGKGSASITTKGVNASDKASTVAIGYDIQTDAPKNAANAKLDVSFSGVKIPVELRSVDKAVYVKFSDLSTVQALASGFAGPETGAAVSQLSKQITNKWIEFDESLVKSATSDKCSILSSSNQLSEKDINQIISLYDKNTFIDINKTSSDTVDGRKVTKADLGINKDKAKAFGKDFEQLDMVKKLNACGGDKVASSDSAKKADNSKTTYEFTIWVDRSKKEIVKVSLKASDDKTSVSADFTYNKDKVDIQKPTGAIPAMQLLGQLAPFLGGAGATGAATGAAGVNPSLLQ